MKDLQLWRWLRDGGASPAELAALLRELAALPLEQRFPWLGRLGPALEHPKAEVRAAAIAVLAGASGWCAFRWLTKALKDRARSVRLAAVESLRISAAADPERWVHALYHPDAEVRRAAIGGHCVKGSEAYLIPLLSDQALASRVAERLSGLEFSATQLALVIAQVRQGVCPRRLGRRIIAHAQTEHDVWVQAIGDSPQDTLMADILDLFFDEGADQEIERSSGRLSAVMFGRLHEAIRSIPDDRQAEAADKLVALLGETAAARGRWNQDADALYTWLVRAFGASSQQPSDHKMEEGSGAAAPSGQGRGGDLPRVRLTTEEARSFAYWPWSRKRTGKAGRPRVEDNAIKEFLQLVENEGETSVFRILGSKDLDLLEQWAHSDNPMVAAAATARLVELGWEDLPISILRLPADVVASLLRQFLDSGIVQSPATRTAAARWLHHQGDRFGFPLVIAASLADEDLASGLLRDVEDTLLVECVKAGLVSGPSVVPEQWLLQRLLELDDGPHQADSLAILAREAVDKEVCQRAVQHLVSRPTRSWKLRALADVFAWGMQVAWELTGRAFVIEMIAGEEWGYTDFEGSTIWVNPLPILRQEENGLDIVRGLILHELGHHKYHRGRHAESIWRRARAQGIHGLLNLVADEHLERNLRALDSGYGNMFKRLASYVFYHSQREVPVENLFKVLGPQTFEVLTHAHLTAARKKGCVRINSGHVLRAAEQANHSFARFLRALRMGLGNRWDDPLVAEALTLFGPDFRRSSMDDLLQVAGRLQEIFGVQTGLLHVLVRGLFDEYDLIVHGEGTDNEDIKADIRRRHRRFFERAATGGEPGKARVTRFSDEHVPQRVKRVPYDAAAQRAYTLQAARAARQLRHFLVRSAMRAEAHARRVQGTRIDRARVQSLVLRADPRILMLRQAVHAADLFLGVLIDCSYEMASSMEKAKVFATVIAEAAKRLPGIEARFFGFSHDWMFDAGDANQPAIHGLETHCCKNEAAALCHVAEIAEVSGRKNRLLVMIGEPREDELLGEKESLRKLLVRFARRNIRCVQIAVTPPETRCYPNILILGEEDLVKCTRQFGRLCVRIAR